MVRFVSTRDKNGPSCRVSEALLKGLAPDGGLYVPSTMPQRPSDFTLKEGVAYAMYQAIKPFFEGDELEGDLLQICQDAFNFPVPMKNLGGNKVLLELIYGPTSAFKDFGARFLAFSMEKRRRKDNPCRHKRRYRRSCRSCFLEKKEPEGKGAFSKGQGG